MSIKRAWTDEQLIDAVNKNFSISGVLKSLGMKPLSGYYTHIKGYIQKLNLDVSHFTGQGHLKGRTHNWNKKIPLEQILVENSPYKRNNLKSRLLREGLIKNECAICGQPPIWNGKPLVMVLDHKNGVNDDNRLENLRLICRHCDSQLPTFCGRNVKNKRPINYCKCGEIIKRNSKTCTKCRIKNTFPKERKPRPRKVIRPSKEELQLLIKTTPLTSIGKKYGVSDNAVRKWCKYENVDFKNIRTKYKRVEILN